jgi:hypothetical protein
MNTRKIVHAVAALVLAATAVLMLPQPAQAAPAGACAVEEWKDPRNWRGCAARLRQAATTATGCVTAPTPGSPTSGMAGWFALRPDSSLRDGVQGQYSIYGVAGYGLDTYDLGCLTTIKHPDLQLWSSIANGEFMSAAAMVGASNWLRAHAYDPGSVWGWSDGFVAQTTGAIYKYVFNVFGALTLLGVGLYLIWRARHGHMSEAVKVAAWAMAAMVVTITVASSPERAVHGADSIATGGLSFVHSVLGPAPQDIPADQCDLGHPEACKDNRSVATRASDTVTYAILYRTWLTAVLGDANSEVAQKYGPALFDATTMSWGEAARVDGNPTLREQLLQDKAATFKTIADQIKTEDPVAYEYLQGVHGMDRAGAGFIAFLSALAFVVFDAAASLVILFGFGILRLAIPMIPLFATIGMFHPASGALRRVGNAAAAAIFNIAVFGALAGVYLTAVVEIFNSPLPGFAQFVVIALIGAAGIWCTRPLRMMVSTATGRSRGEDSLIARAFNGVKEIAANQRPAGAETVTTTTTTTDGGPVRPEVARAATSTTRTVATTVAPSVTAAATAVMDHPTVKAGVDAAREQRPEGDTGRARLARVGAAMVDATPAVSSWTATAPEPTPTDEAAPAAAQQPIHRPPTRRPRPHPEKKD